MVFVDYGTLLGVIRDKKIIEWDDDIDLGIIINDLFTWNNLEEIMYSFGLKKKHEFVYNNEITEQNYEKDYVSVDFFRHYEANDYSISYFYDRNKNKKYPAENFYEWHHYLTGSCEMGRKSFMQDRNITFDDMYTVDEFITLCENSYGGEIIKELKERWNCRNGSD